MRKKIISELEYRYKYDLPYDKRDLEEWREYLSKTPLKRIEKACQKEGMIFKKHLKVPRENKKSADGKYYTVIPPGLADELIDKWENKWQRIFSKIDPEIWGEQLWASSIFQTDAIECTGCYIDTLALPIVRTYKDKKRCPIQECYKKYELKGKDCYLRSPWFQIEHLSIVTNKQGYHIPYLLNIKTCRYTGEPYLIESIPKILVKEINKIPSTIDEFNEDLICPYCACDKKESLHPVPHVSMESFEHIFKKVHRSDDYKLLGKEVYLGGEYNCDQCTNTFSVVGIPSASFDILESHEELLKKGKFGLFKKIMNDSNIRKDKIP